MAISQFPVNGFLLVEPVIKFGIFFLLKLEVAEDFFLLSMVNMQTKTLQRIANEPI